LLGQAGRRAIPNRAGDRSEQLGAGGRSLPLEDAWRCHRCGTCTTRPEGSRVREPYVPACRASWPGMRTGRAERCALGAGPRLWTHSSAGRPLMKWFDRSLLEHVFLSKFSEEARMTSAQPPLEHGFAAVDAQEDPHTCDHGERAWTARRRGRLGMAGRYRPSCGQRSTPLRRDVLPRRRHPTVHLGRPSLSSVSNGAPSARIGSWSRACSRA
jgi:hypothetical protein